MLHVGWTTRAARQTCRTGHVHHIAATRGPWMVDLKIKLTYNTKKSETMTASVLLNNDTINHLISSGANFNTSGWDLH